MTDHWYKDAIIYAVDVETYYDANGDGVGDFQGLIARLDHLGSLGVTCLWLLPFFPSPNRDNGYDITDHCAVDPRLGTLADVRALLAAAAERGIRVIFDLVVQHTSDEHHWFQAARADSRSPYRDYYIWTAQPPDPDEETIFPGEDTRAWTYDAQAGAFYYHRFYRFEPDLNIANPAVRAEIRRIIDFWLQFDIAGFRLDAIPHMLERKGVAGTEVQDPEAFLRELRAAVTERREGAALLAETDVTPDQVKLYFGDGDRMHMLLNFLLNNDFFLALAREQAEPLSRGLQELPVPPPAAQWVNFLRNLDELDLERLSDAERQEVFGAFAPEPEMRIYGRGIRRRLAPMLGGERRRLELALSLLFALPGTPMLVYGDEIGMGDDLSIPGRASVRTPMQWSPKANGGFSTAPPEQLVCQVVTDGPYRYQQVNVADQMGDPASLLSWVRRLVAMRRALPALGRGTWRVIETGAPEVLAHSCATPDEELVVLHNLSRRPCELRPNLGGAAIGSFDEIFSDRVYGPSAGGADGVQLAGYGYRWFRCDGSWHEPH